MKWSTLGLSTIVSLFLLQGPALPQEIEEDFFDEPDPDIWQMYGSASWDSVTESVVITPPAGGNGKLVYLEPVTLERLTVTFTVEISRGNGADGMAFFVVAGDTPPVLGNGGSGIGIVNVPGPIFHVELDTYGGTQDWEGGGTAANHIGVGFSETGHISGADISPYTQPDLTIRPDSLFPGFDLENSGPITVMVEFDDGHVVVSIQNDTYCPDLTQIIEGDLEGWIGPFDGLLGFSGATGGLVDRHEVHYVKISGPPENRCARVKRSLPISRFEPDKDFLVTLEVSDVCGRPQDPCRPPNAPETATIVETLPDGWRAFDPTPPGVVGPENVVTWRFTGGSFGAGELTYRVLPDDRCTPVTISGTLTCSGFDREVTVGGDRVLSHSCAFGVDGYIATWLVLGPIGDQGGCDVGPAEIQADYLTDGVENQAEIRPYDGMPIEIDFALPENAGDIYYGPRNADDLPFWRTIYDSDGGIDYNGDHMVGMQNDNVMAYAICYVTNTTDEEIEAWIATGSDDALEVWFDDQVWTMDTCRGWGWPTPQEVNGPVTLLPGVQHRVMTKTFEQGGGWNFYLRFQDENGIPITEGLEVSLVPYRPLAIARSLSIASYKPGDSVTVTLTLSDVMTPPPTAVAIAETLPAGWTATSASDGGTIAGRSITWNLTGAAIADGKTVTYQLTAPKGIVAVFSGSFVAEGLSFRIGGATQLPRSPIPAESLSPWLVADIGTPLAGGQERIADNAFNIWGGGADIAGRADSFRFVYQSTSGGDLAMWVRVDGQDATHASAKAGLMVRQSLDPGSPFYFVQLTPKDGAGPRYRTTAGGSVGPVMPISTKVDPPIWLKLVRSSNSFTAFTSTDGSTWEQNFRTATHRNPRAITLTEPVLVGFAVTAADAEKISGAMFRDFRCEGPGCPSTAQPEAARFIRGDTDGTGNYTIGDGIQILERQFAGRAAYGSNCDETGDIDGNGVLTIGDAIWLFNYLFAGGPSPAPPAPACGDVPIAQLKLGCAVGIVPVCR